MLVLKIFNYFYLPVSNSSVFLQLILKPQHYAIFRIGITAPTYEGLFNGQAFVETQYEVLIFATSWFYFKFNLIISIFIVL